MADNTILNTGTGGDSIRDKDRSGVKTQIAALDLNPAGAESLMAGFMPSKIVNGLLEAGIEPFGALQVNNGFQTLFYDSWSTALDTTDKWTVTGNAPTIANGNMTMSATLSSYNAIRTKDTVRANVGFSLVRNGISIETAVATGAGRFWGLGTTAVTPAVAVLAQDGIGFEIDQAAGTLLAVTYVAGVRTTVATLTRPTDGITHAYGLYFRVTQAYWILDGAVVASQSFPNVQMVELPALIVRQNAAAFTGTPAYVNIAHLTADTSRQGTTVSDPIIGTRQARVKKASTAAVATDEALVVTMSPNSATVTVVQQVITKGTQGATGVTTQDLKDAGRNAVHFYMVIPVLTSATDTLQSLTGTKAGATVVATTTPAVVTTGKTYRVTRLSATYIATATSGYAIVRLRFNTAGVVAVTSPIAATLCVGASTPATANSTGSEEAALDEGWEFAASTGVGISVQGFAAVTATAVGYVLVSLTGYEY